MQKATTSSSMSSPLQSSTTSPGVRKNRRKFFGRRRFRDALMAFLEEEDAGEEEGLEDEQVLADMIEEESVDIQRIVTGSFSHGGFPNVGSFYQCNLQHFDSIHSGHLPSGDLRTGVQSTKPRAGDQEDAAVLPEGRSEQWSTRWRTRSGTSYKRWVKQQQKTEPCFICRQLGHWSQECPYRNKALVHATNVTFPAGNR